MKNADFKELAARIHQNAKLKGFWDNERNMGEVFMLIISELGEALEAHRKGKFANWPEFNVRASQINGVRNTEEMAFIYAFENEIKDTFEDELADVVIRLLDYVGYRNVNIGLHLYDVDFKTEFKDDVNVGECLLNLTNKFLAIYELDDWEFNQTTPDKSCLGGLILNIEKTLHSIFSLSNHFSIDLMKHIYAKMKYNSTREKLHGKLY